ncbi:MAG: biotin/lipoyl-binding protein, partial [Anaerolineae bacterium]|nr:biotin/lipoyl-binding protein [Anaerolineae bacterium]
MDAHKRLLCVLAPLVIAALTGCQRGASGVPESTFSSTAAVTRGTVAEVVQIYGQVVAPTSQMLCFGARGGRVVEVMVRQGETVEEGQPLVRLDTTDLERELREAEADLE